ncbi:LacI family DNA-binding transcriptional regulator [Actinophytocola glycyrrhizae]|uniref:LacI family DNA-binding transcriptional regulator n=1 Tax=Actinophytocola glycyrrhizae TaxID=2044873 RepID=A0ABV9S416_9PSEU
MGKRTTIGDVASAAGVSVATVSRVLNGGAVREDTAARVLAAVTSLEYTPNALTRSIFSGRSTTIGVVIRDLSSPFYLDLMRGIDEVASANDSLVMFANSYRLPDREVAHVRTMDEQRVRGLIVTTGEPADSRTRGMTANGTPCVVVARTVADPPPGLHSVSLDNVAAGRLMAGHLAACGRSAVGVVRSGQRQSQVERTAGLGAGLVDAGLPSPAVVEAATEEEVPTAVAGLLEGRPDAVVCMTGRLTVATYQALTAAGRAVPEDVAFLTMDEFTWAAALGITVVAQPSYDMGRQAASLVVEAPAEPVRRVFAPTLVARRSCGE